MSNPEISRLPKFFNYKGEDTDNGYETIQDFYLSWMLRCADDKYKILNSKIHEYAKRTVFLLFYGQNNKDNNRFEIDNKYEIDSIMDNEFRVLKVETWRQWKSIDLIAEIDIEVNNNLEKYVFNIENKWYTRIGNSQLETYKKIIEDEYRSKNNTIINFVIFCDDEILYKDSNQIQKCKDNGYKFLTIGDVIMLSKMKEKGVTGNALFDEYWFNS